jgi:hypothetical protein
MFGRPNPRAPGLFPGSLVHGTFFLRLGFWTIWTSLPMEIYHTVLRGFGWVSGSVSLGRENILVGWAGEQHAGRLYRRSAPLPHRVSAPPTGGTLMLVLRSVPSSSPSLPIAGEAAGHLSLLFPSNSSSPARSLVEGHQDVLLISVSILFQATESVWACGWNSRSEWIGAVPGDRSAWALDWHLTITIPPSLSWPRFQYWYVPIWFRSLYQFP